MSYPYNKNKLLELFYKVKNKITQRDVASIEELINAGEWEIAYENLCTQLYEYQSAISDEIYKDFEEVGKLLNVKDEYWLSVKELIVDVPKDDAV